MFGLNALFETSIVPASAKRSHGKRRLLRLFFSKPHSNLTKTLIRMCSLEIQLNFWFWATIFNSTKFYISTLEINSVDVLALRWQYILLFIYRVSQIYDIHALCRRYEWWLSMCYIVQNNERNESKIEIKIRVVK